MTTAQKDRFIPALSILEGRDLMSASLSDGLLTIKGTTHDDTIRVTQSGDTIWVGEKYTAGQFGEESSESFPRAQVKKILIKGYEGRDFITTYGVNVEAEIRGGPQDDRLAGGLKGDTIYGQGGDDLIYGNEGDDILDGGDGNDTLYGYIGDDVLYGREGNDYLKGDAGRDTLYGWSGNDTLVGTAGADKLDGWVGNDRLEVTLNFDDLIANRGRSIGFSDSFRAGNGVDTVVVTLDLDSFGRRFLKPLTDEVSRMTYAVQPVLDLLDRKVPFLSYFDSGLTFGSILSRQNPTVGRFISSVKTIRGFADSVGTWSGQVTLGTFTLTSGSQAISTVSANPLSQIRSTLLPRLKSAGFSLGLLDNPKSAVRLLLGQQVTLFEVSLPTLNVSTSFSRRWDIPTAWSFGGAGAYVTATVGGRLGLRAGGTFGMDMTGIWAGNVRKGMYLRNASASVSAGLTAGAGVAIGVAGKWELASASLNGGVNGTITFTPTDPNRDGRTYFGELPSNLSKALRTTGSLDYGVWGRLKYWDFGAWKHRWVDWDFYRGTLTL